MYNLVLKTYLSLKNVRELLHTVALSLIIIFRNCMVFHCWKP